MAADGHSDDRSNPESSRRESTTSQLETQQARKAGKTVGRGTGRSRPRASLACMSCRQRKIKCTVPSSAAGHGPGPGAPCNSCRSLQIPCAVSRDGDRRKAGSREQVAALQDRLQFLESLVTRGDGALPYIGQDAGIPYADDHEHAQPAVTPDEATAGAHIADNPQGTDGTDTPFTPLDIEQRSLPADLCPNHDAVVSPLQQDFGDSQLPSVALYPSQIDCREHENAQLLSSNELISRESQSHSSDMPSSINHNLPQQFSRQNSNIRPSPKDPVIIQRTVAISPSSDNDGSRLDLDDDYGRPRYYGPTSQLYIQRRSVAEDGDDLASYGVPPNDLNPESSPLQELLFRIFWRTQPNSTVVVDEQFFETGRGVSIRSEYYSAFLENAMLACASRMSTSEGVRKLGRTYADRAKSSIAHELEEPRISTLQGFLLLSDFEATRGRDRLGYMYCGIACRLVFDLGLSESCDNLVSQGKLSASEASSRHTVFLAAFVFDKLWSFYLGRPSAISVRLLERAHKRSLASGWIGNLTIGSWVGLCADMSEVTDILNETWPLDATARNRLATMDQRICQRFETLPLSIRLHEDRVSELPVNAYGLHIQFYGLRIALHRLSSKAVAQEALEKGLTGHSGPEDDLAQSRAVMQDSAVRIARLVCAYQQICGIENVITVMLDNVYVAAAVMISHHLRPPATGSGTFLSDQRNLERLRSLATMLNDAQRHYPVAARMQATLSSFVDQTNLTGIFKTSGSTQDSAVTLASKTSEAVPRESTATTASASRRQDVEMFENCFGETGPPLFQDMDLNNMMSWMLSPTIEKDGSICLV